MFNVLSFVMSLLHSIPFRHAIHFLACITYIRYTVLSSSHLRVVIPSGLVSRGFLSKILFAPLLSPILDICPHLLVFLDSNRWGCRNINPIESTEIESNVIECGRVQLKCDGTRWRTGGEVRGKLANGVGSQYPSHYLATWCIQHYYRWCAHLGCQ